MNKQEALKLANTQIGSLTYKDAGEALRWAWFGKIVEQIPEHEWEGFLEKALETLVKCDVCGI